jgi:hypothetical protein
MLGRGRGEPDFDTSLPAFADVWGTRVRVWLTVRRACPDCGDGHIFSLKCPRSLSLCLHTTRRGAEIRIG